MEYGYGNGSLYCCCSHDSWNICINYPSQTKFSNQMVYMDSDWGVYNIISLPYLQIFIFRIKSFHALILITNIEKKTNNFNTQEITKNNCKQFLKFIIREINSIILKGRYILYIYSNDECNVVFLWLCFEYGSITV